MRTFPLKGGPMDGEIYVSLADAEFYWLVPWPRQTDTLVVGHGPHETYHLLPNHADLQYREIEDAVGLYQRVVLIVDRRREDYLLYRELPHGEPDVAVVG